MLKLFCVKRSLLACICAAEVLMTLDLKVCLYQGIKVSRCEAINV
jgi:hypothetical protein